MKTGKTRINCMASVAVAVWVCSSATAINAQTPLGERRFEEGVRRVMEVEGPERFRRAMELSAAHMLSSMQVKEIASRLNDDGARLEFASAAFARTADPENFYEVYDAFSTFSKVMRLHDRIHHLSIAVPTAALPPPTTPIPPPPPPTVSETEMRDIIRSLRRESFDQTRTKLAHQILSTSPKKFLASQVKQMLDCFDFEPSKIELAKFAYQYTFDPEHYHLINESFSFPNSREELSRFIQSGGPPPGQPGQRPPPRR